jgi:hypothetical protein
MMMLLLLLLLLMMMMMMMTIMKWPHSSIPPSLLACLHAARHDTQQQGELEPIRSSGVNPYDVRKPCTPATKLCYDFDYVDQYLNRCGCGRSHSCCVIRVCVYMYIKKIHTHIYIDYIWVIDVHIYCSCTLRRQTSHSNLPPCFSLEEPPNHPHPPPNTHTSTPTPTPTYIHPPIYSPPPTPSDDVREALGVDRNRTWRACNEGVALVSCVGRLGVVSFGVLMVVADA